MDIDLTEAVEAAARAASEQSAFLLNGDRYSTHGPWDSLTPAVQHALRELVLPLVTAAAPFITLQMDPDRVMKYHPDLPPENFHG